MFDTLQVIVCCGEFNLHSGSTVLHHHDKLKRIEHLLVVLRFKLQCKVRKSVRQASPPNRLSSGSEATDFN